jgi:hypothetical protein
MQNATARLTERAWFVYVEGAGAPVGPLSAAQLAHGLREGTVPRSASVQRGGAVWWSGILDEPDVIAALKAL